jgi:hypothetical protein
VVVLDVEEAGADAELGVGAAGPVYRRGQQLRQSSTAPDAVTHECSQCGDRKNTSAGREVWVSATSTNQHSQSRHSSSSRSQARSRPG